jgi:hypothetical protein
LINLNDIKGRSAVSILEDYEGINPYIKKLKQEYLKNRKITLILPIDDFMQCTKKSWNILRDSIKKDLIESKHIEVITKEPQ